MKGGGQPSAALAVGSRAIVNQKTLSASIGGTVAPRCLGTSNRANCWRSHQTTRFNLRRHAAAESPAHVAAVSASSKSR
jgi:hypothetical protein